MDAKKIEKKLEEGFKNLKSEVSKEITAFRKETRLFYCKNGVKELKNIFKQYPGGYKHCQEWFNKSIKYRKALLKLFSDYVLLNPESQPMDFLDYQETYL